MLSDNAYRHHDTQQRQPAGFHTAPLVKVTFGIQILKKHSHSHSQIADNSPYAGHAPYYSPGTAQTPQTPVPIVPADDVARANLAAMVAKMLTGIAFHAQCSVRVVAEVLLATVQRRREMSARREGSRHVSGDISCALSANGCDIATD